MTMQEIWEKIKLENARSKEKHGMWRDTSPLVQRSVIDSEFCEWWDACMAGDVDGEHGEKAELIQLANVCIRRIMALTGERDA